jgi:hypothetical protein
LNASADLVALPIDPPPACSRGGASARDLEKPHTLSPPGVPVVTHTTRILIVGALGKGKLPSAGLGSVALDPRYQLSEHDRVTDAVGLKLERLKRAKPGFAFPAVDYFVMVGACVDANFGFALFANDGAAIAMDRHIENLL